MDRIVERQEMGTQRESERGNDMQQRAASGIKPGAVAVRTIAFVCGAPGQ